MRQGIDEAPAAWRVQSYTPLPVGPEYAGQRVKLDVGQVGDRKPKSVPGRLLAQANCAPFHYNAAHLPPAQALCVSCTGAGWRTPAGDAAPPAGGGARVGRGEAASRDLGADPGQQRRAEAQGVVDCGQEGLRLMTFNQPSLGSTALAGVYAGRWQPSTAGC